MKSITPSIHQWSRVTSCTSLFIFILITALPVRTAILASWDEWADTTDAYNADYTSPGFSSNLNQVGSTTSRINTTFGSNDGQFGTIGSAVTTANSLLVSNNVTDTLYLTITNNSGSETSIDSLHFDFGPREGGNSTDYGFNAFTLRYLSGGLGPDSTVIDTQTNLSYILVQSNNPLEDLLDFDYNLADDLSDVTLADGESAQFEFVFSGHAGSNGGNVSSVLDNIAIQGSAIPEPGSLILFLLTIAGRLIYRARHRN
ncbi:hypothetical protein P0Y35_01875 [Kiritimatiellaeota bacterium B1221]|nr:hypothetical protein [Kiritimatiellaeota bacterium B1221]